MTLFILIYVPPNGYGMMSHIQGLTPPATRHESHVDTHTDEAPEGIAVQGMSAGVRGLGESFGIEVAIVKHGICIG